MTDLLDIADGSRLPETTRIARILDMIWRVYARPRYWTRRRLADEFEVSERTIGLDLEIIRNRLGLEVHTERGKGYYFERVPQLPSVVYSVPEALALVLAAEAGRHTAGISPQDLSSAIARLESVLPGNLGRLVRRRGEDRASGVLTHRERMLQTCTQAISGSNRLAITYSTAYRGGAISEREVDPYAVFPYERAWHLVAFCHLRDGPRVFKIDRIRSALILPASFQVPSDFDLNAFLNEGWGLMRGLGMPVEPVELRFSPAAAPWIVDEQWHPTQEVHREDDGSLTFRLTIEITPEFQRWVFGYGSEVAVVRPEHLREWVCGEANALLSRSREL